MVNSIGIFKSASSSRHIFNRHTSSIGIHLQIDISSIDISSTDISSINISSGARCRVCGCKSGVHREDSVLHGANYSMNDN